METEDRMMPSWTFVQLFLGPKEEKASFLAFLFVVLFFYPYMTELGGRESKEREKTLGQNQQRPIDASSAPALFHYNDNFFCACSFFFQTNTSV